MREDAEQKVHGEVGREQDVCVINLTTGQRVLHVPKVNTNPS